MNSTEFAIATIFMFLGAIVSSIIPPIVNRFVHQNSDDKSGIKDTLRYLLAANAAWVVAYVLLSTFDLFGEKSAIDPIGWPSVTFAATLIISAGLFALGMYTLIDNSDELPVDLMPLRVGLRWLLMGNLVWVVADMTSRILSHEIIYTLGAALSVLAFVYGVFALRKTRPS